MDLAFSPPAGLAWAALLLAGLLGAILPTCLYVYVEPRGRRQWAVAGDAPSSRRAPRLVRFTAWLGFVLSQLALPLLLVPVTCGGLLYVQIRLGALSPTALGATAALGLAALVQSVVALRHVPLGVRLLARHAGEGKRAGGLARFHALVHGAVLAGALSLGWAMSAIPGFVRPVLRHTLEWTAVRPVAAYALVCLLHAWLLARCGRMLAEKLDK
jgi:hypothetical protein